MPLALEMSSQHMGVFQYEIRLKAHLFFLEWGQEVRVIHRKTFSIDTVNYGELSITCFLHEHDAPGEPVPLFGPEQLTGIEQIPPG